MTLQELQELGQLPAIVASSPDSVTCIIKATTQICKCVGKDDMQQLISLLESRARALALVASFDAALRDATAIQSLNKSSAIGYKCAGQVYEQQGRHVAAIKEYTKGLANMTMPDPELERSICVAKETMNKKIDLMGLLPDEVVVTDIIPRLMGSEPLHSSKPCPYLYVSRVWRERILQHNFLSLQISEESNPDNQVQHTELLRFAPFIESLHVKQQHGKGPWRILAQATFRSLRKLYIEGDAFDWYQDEPQTVLQVIGGGLAYLHIDIWHAMSIKLEDIMQVCRNLVSCRLGGSVAFDTSSLCNYTFPKLLELAMYNGYLTLPQEKLEPIFKALPGLTHLSLQAAIESRPLPLLQQYCSRLEWLSLQCGFVFPLTGRRKGTAHGMVLQFRQKCYMEDVVSLVRTHAEKLEFFILAVKSMDEIACHHDTQFPRLEQLTLNSTEDYHAGFSTWMITNAPNLCSISLRASAIHPKTLNCLRFLQHLQHLKLNFISDPCDNSCHQALEKLFKHHVDLGAMSTLEEIDVFNISPATSSTYANSVVPSWLFLIPHLARIKRFTLVPEFDMDASFLWFMDTLAQNSLELEEISLELASYSIAQGVLAPLQQLKNLKSIVIRCDKLCEHDILGLQSCPALNHLCIHTQINQLSQSTQDALSASIKRVTII